MVINISVYWPHVWDFHYQRPLIGSIEQSVRKGGIFFKGRVFFHRFCQKNAEKVRRGRFCCGVDDFRDTTLLKYMRISIPQILMLDQRCVVADHHVNIWEMLTGDICKKSSGRASHAFWWGWLYIPIASTASLSIPRKLKLDQHMGILAYI